MAKRSFIWSSSLAAVWCCAACGGGGTDPGPVGRGIVIATSPATSDTVTATPVQGLVLEVRDESGHPAVGATVRVSGLPSATRPGLTMEVGSPTQVGYSGFVAQTSDARGRVTVRLRFGTVAGPGRVEMTVPELGFVDTASFTVQPGAAAGVRLSPRDTAVLVNHSLQFAGGVVDRFQNTRSDPVIFSVLATPAGIGSINASGLLTAIAPGLLKVTGTFGQASDQVAVAIMPEGVVLVNENMSTLVTMRLDGSDRHVISPIASTGYGEPEWSPDGSEILMTGIRSVDRVALDGTHHALSLPPVLGLVDAFWPTSSPDRQNIYFTNVSGFTAAGLWRISSDGSVVQQILPGEQYRPSVSSDNRFLAFHSLGGQDVVVQLYDLVTSAVIPLNLPGRFPQWSHLGDSLAYLENGNGRLRIVRRDGSGQRYVTPSGTGYPDGPLSWSPDDKWIILRGQLGLEIINVATGVSLQMPNSQTLFQPSWKPVFP